MRALMMQVIRLEQRNQEIHIEERPHAITGPLRSWASAFSARPWQNAAS
jgi:hypothetical protein